MKPLQVAATTCPAAPAALALSSRVVRLFGVNCVSLQGELLELAMSDPAKFEEENPKTAAFIKERNA